MLFHLRLNRDSAEPVSERFNGFSWLSQRANIASDGMIGLLKVNKIAAPFQCGGGRAL